MELVLNQLPLPNQLIHLNDFILIDIACLFQPGGGGDVVEGTLHSKQTIYGKYNV